MRGENLLSSRLRQITPGLALLSASRVSRSMSPVKSRNTRTFAPRAVKLFNRRTRQTFRREGRKENVRKEACTVFVSRAVNVTLMGGHAVAG